MQLRRDTYSRLTPVQRLQVARHPNRPTFLDVALNITDKFVELHGDRAGLDDPAMVCGIGSMDGVSFMFIGHQKGRNTKVLGDACTRARGWRGEGGGEGGEGGCILPPGESHVVSLEMREKGGSECFAMRRSMAALLLCVLHSVRTLLEHCAAVLHTGEYLPKLRHASAQRLPQGTALHAPRRQVRVPHRDFRGHAWSLRWQER